MKIGDEVYVHGYVDEIRDNTVIIRNDGGYFGTVPSEVFCYEEDRNGYGTLNEADTPQTDCEDIYPLVIIKDRYTGVYSNGKYTAWNMYFDEIPQDIEEDDVSCRNFWYSYDGTVGLGETPNEAIEDLRKKLNTERNEE